MYCRELTRKELEEMGFIHLRKDGDNWIVYRDWYKNNSKNKYVHTIVVKPITNKLKNGNEKQYRTLTWSYKNKTYSATIGRFAMAWKLGYVPEGYVIDHIKNDSLEDNYDNWQPLTIKNNNRKRFKDNPGYKCFNQYKNTKNE